MYYVISTYVYVFPHTDVYVRTVRVCVQYCMYVLWPILSIHRPASSKTGWKAENHNKNLGESNQVFREIYGHNQQMLCLGTSTPVP